MARTQERFTCQDCIIFDTMARWSVRRRFPRFFYRSSSKNEPVREWLQTLTKAEKFRVGVDIWKAQSEWPVGMPHVGSLGKGLHEVRSSLPNGIARVLFIVDGTDMVLLDGFFQKTQATPPEALALAKKRRQDYEQGKKK